LRAGHERQVLKKIFGIEKSAELRLAVERRMCSASVSAMTSSISTQMRCTGAP